MGLFGSKATTTVKVKPSWQVDQILRDVVKRSNNIDQQFIEHQFAQLTPEQQNAINTVAQSGNLRTAAGALSPRLMQGVDQITDVNKQLQGVVNAPISANQALSEANVLRNGTYSKVTQSAANAGGVANKFGAAGRVQARRNATSQAAQSALNPEFTNTAISNLNRTAQGKLDTASMAANIATGNQNLGMQGIQLNQQANQNQLNAGNFMQSYQNAMNTNNFQNANQKALFPWEKINNQLNVLNQVSPMAGYTQKGVTAATPMGQQLAAAGVAGLSIYGKLGGFSGGDETNVTGYDQQGQAINTPVNQWSNNQGTGMFNQIGSWMGGK
ncbi:hypothetical protein P9477_23255 [Enterobacter mori]|uniref:hypothetical protein n=1 Tax=Enterobacter mori TaxID=539813 RepID=UPI00398B95AD